MLIINGRHYRLSMDVYPQLPPQAFFQQVKEYPNRPSVLIGAEKRCYPGPNHAARCTRMPTNSPLAEDIYGEFTDIVNKTGKAGNLLDVDPDLDDPSSWVYGMYETIRPRYINSGSESKSIVSMQKVRRELFR